MSKRTRTKENKDLFNEIIPIPIIYPDTPQSMTVDSPQAMDVLSPAPPEEGIVLEPESGAELSASPLIEALSNLSNTYKPRLRSTHNVDHTAKEKLRRERIKESCDQLRVLLPYVKGRKTDMASILETCADYLSIVNSVLPKAFVVKVSEVMSEDAVTNQTRSRATKRSSLPPDAPPSSTPLSYSPQSSALPLLTSTLSTTQAVKALNELSSESMNTKTSTGSNCKMAKTSAPAKKIKNMNSKSSKCQPVTLGAFERNLIDNLLLRLDTADVNNNTVQSEPRRGTMNATFQPLNFLPANYFLPPVVAPQNYGMTWDTSRLPYPQLPIVFSDDPTLQGFNATPPASLDPATQTPAAPTQFHPQAQPVMCVKNRFTDTPPQDDWPDLYTCTLSPDVESLIPDFSSDPESLYVDPNVILDYHEVGRIVNSLG